jgi:uncharacterized protein YjbI with pentapeptide repeats
MQLVEWFLYEAPWLVRVGAPVGLLLILLLVGYTIGAAAIGFGPHVVKETQMTEYPGEAVGRSQLSTDVKKGYVTGIATPTKRSITRETQSYRTIWDWMTVLTISAVIAAVALTFTWSQAKQQRFVQDQQARDSALLAYLDTMSGLIFDKHLLDTSDEENVVRQREAARDVARARTLVALLAVGPERKRDVVRFLYEAELISAQDRVVDLNQANLTDADLSKMPLTGVDLRGANLSDGIDEPNARGANLRKTSLQNASLEEAKLKSANLEGAMLQDASLQDANLRDANLRGAILETDASADTNTKLLTQQGAHLQGATMPNGQRYETWLKDQENDGGSGETGHGRTRGTSEGRPHARDAPKIQQRGQT